MRIKENALTKRNQTKSSNREIKEISILKTIQTKLSNKKERTIKAV